MRQASVFLVEDEVLIGMMLADMIEQLGHRVVAEAANIQDGQTLAQSANYDLAVLDINIGGHSIDPVAEIIDRRGLPFSSSAATDRAADPNNSVTGLCCKSP
jgi:DNA-binding response OmpR family regulator